MYRTLKKYLAFILAACMLLGLAVTVRAEDQDLRVINMTDSKVEVYPDGYTVNGGEKQIFSGEYIFMAGSVGSTIDFHNGDNGEAVSYDVTFSRAYLTDDEGSDHGAVRLYNGVTLNLFVDGESTLVGEAGPAIKLDSGRATLVTTIGENGCLSLSRSNLDSDFTDSGIEEYIYFSGDTECLPSWSSEDTIISFSANHILQCYDNGDGTHRVICLNCWKEFEAEEHVLSYISEGDGAHHYIRCDKKCGYVKYDIPCTWDDGVPTEKYGVAATLYTCTVCGQTKVEINGSYDTENSMHIHMTDLEGDGWNSAAVIVKRNGEVWQNVTFDEGSESDVYLEYSDDNVYQFVWKSGEFDEECSLNVTLPGSTEPVYEKSDFEDTADSTELFSLNKADYTKVNEAVSKIPSSLGKYTDESQSRLNEAVSSVNWSMHVSRQAEVDVYAKEIEAAIDALVLMPSSESAQIDISEGDIYITETGYRRTADGEETQYTGSYIIYGSTSENHIIVESGSHNIEFRSLLIGLYSNEMNAVNIKKGASVSLILSGNNTLKNNYRAVLENNSVIHVPVGAELNITGGSGSLNIGSYSGYSAGIGGESREGAGTINIYGGTINCTVSNRGAGIGSGELGYGGNINISGGNVTVWNANRGAAIGGGYDGMVDSITITGGNINVGSDRGAAIGGGYTGMGGKIRFDGGLIVIDERHNGEVILGNSPEDGLASRINYVVINGGNIISDDPDAIYPQPKNDNGELLSAYELTTPSELADMTVVVGLPNGDTKLVQAYGTKLIVYLPSGIDIDKLSISKVEEITPTPEPTDKPDPTPTETPEPSGTPDPSGSPTPSTTPGTTVSPTATPGSTKVPGTTVSPTTQTGKNNVNDAKTGDNNNYVVWIVIFAAAISALATAAVSKRKNH